MNFLEKKELKIIIFILLIIFTIIFLREFKKDNYKILNSYIGDNVANHENENETKTKTIWVDIDGEVNKPGVYEVEDGTRLFELLEIAGGFTKNAYTKEVNRSILLKEEDKIYIKSIMEINTMQKENKININTASKNELMKLNGIGDSISGNIISYREKNKFQTIEDIKMVNGIGDAKFDAIKDHIKVK